MKLVSSRRLTGPNLLWSRAGAVIDVQFDLGDSADAFVAAWRAQIQNMLTAVGWGTEQTCERRYTNGVSLAISAPIDCLYAATDVNDWAFEAAAAKIGGNEVGDFEQAAVRLTELIRGERNPKLLDFIDGAEKHRVPWLCDDDNVSLGYGRYSRTWPVSDIPDAEAIDWNSVAAIPIGLVTGTNGKTTCVRLAAAILRAAGLHVGLSSTDWVASADEIIERGDFSGPGGARTVLRANRVEAAVLETARGGMLRRGLAVRRADAAVITNIAADHLGEFGVETVEQLLDVKWIVAQACDQHSRLVLNADDALLAARGCGAPINIIWFSLDPAHRLLENTADKCTVEHGKIVLYENDTRHELLPVVDIPVTLGGVAVHNISNVLAAVGLTAAMGIAPSAMANGLAAMDNQDNPGRCNQYLINGARVLVDFAHNPHGVNAFLDIARSAPGTRQLLLIGQAGDRRDEDIRELAQASATIPLHRIIVKELNQFARGRPCGETAVILRNEFVHRGIEPGRISIVENELDAVHAAIDWAQPGDLLMLLIHEDRDNVSTYLQTLSGDAALA